MSTAYYCGLLHERLLQNSRESFGILVKPDLFENDDNNFDPDQAKVLDFARRHSDAETKRNDPTENREMSHIEDLTVTAVQGDRIFDHALMASDDRKNAANEEITQSEHSAVQLIEQNDAAVNHTMSSSPTDTVTAFTPRLEPKTDDMTSPEVLDKSSPKSAADVRDEVKIGAKKATAGTVMTPEKMDHAYYIHDEKENIFEETGHTSLELKYERRMSDLTYSSFEGGSVWGNDFDDETDRVDDPRAAWCGSTDEYWRKAVHSTKEMRQEAKNLPGNDELVLLLQAEMERLFKERNSLQCEVKYLKDSEKRLLTRLRDSENEKKSLRYETARLDDIRSITYMELKGLLILQHEENERLRRKMKTLERRRNRILLVTVFFCVVIVAVLLSVDVPAVGGETLLSYQWLFLTIGDSPSAYYVYPWSHLV